LYKELSIHHSCGLFLIGLVVSEGRLVEVSQSETGIAYASNDLHYIKTDALL
jgi:hypothetical protein